VFVVVESEAKIVESEPGVTELLLAVVFNFYLGKRYAFPYFLICQYHYQFQILFIFFHILSSSRDTNAT